jgi:histone arginine demethylase JMJD6
MYGDVDRWADGIERAEAGEARDGETGGGGEGEPSAPRTAAPVARAELLAGGQRFAIPPLFQDCALVVPRALRPPACDGVFLAGPRGSGSPPHVDDDGFTAAWNWLLAGAKRWVLFPPGTPRDALLGLDRPGLGRSRPGAAAAGGAGSTGEAAAEGAAAEDDFGVAAQVASAGCGYWWSAVYPSLKRRAGELGLVECVQRAGECLFIPAGWWHAVLNDSPWTVAVTYNLVPAAALPAAFVVAQRGDPAFARRWWKCLRRFRPAAAAQLQAAAPAAVAAARAPEQMAAEAEVGVAGDASADENTAMTAVQAKCASPVLLERIDALPV